MTRMTALTPATAKGTAQEMLTDPSPGTDRSAPVATMAHSPAVLGGYLQLSKAMKRAKLSRRVTEPGSQPPAMEPPQTGGLRHDRHRPGDLQQPTAVTDTQVEELRAFGYTDREIVDAVGVALGLLTGAFNLIAGLEPDQAAST